MITLTPRLLACAQAVSAGGTVCDIGTDHAYLPVFLVQSGHCRSAAACDIGAGPLEAARQTVTKYGLSKMIRLVLTDGLQGLDLQQYSDIVIAGMGGETICAILGGQSWTTESPRLILQPMTRIDVLRHWLAENGFLEQSAQAVQEDSRIYLVLTVQYTGQTRQLSPLEACVGALNSKDQAARQYGDKQKQRILRKATGLQRAGLAAAEELQLTQQLDNWLEEE